MRMSLRAGGFVAAHLLKINDGTRLGRARQEDHVFSRLLDAQDDFLEIYINFEG
jgi:hypothetical protein